MTEFINTEAMKPLNLAFYAEVWRRMKRRTPEKVQGVDHRDHVIEIIAVDETYVAVFVRVHGEYPAECYSMREAYDHIDREQDHKERYQRPINEQKTQTYN